MMKVERGDIFYVKDVHSEEHEQWGNRPVIVVSNESCNIYSSVIEVVYLTTSLNAGKTLPTHVLIESADYISMAKCEHIHSISKSKLENKIGHCTRDEIRRVNTALLISLGIGWDV